MRIIKSNQNNIPSLLKEMKCRAGETDRKVLDVVEEILKDVREHGDEAIRKYERKFCGLSAEPFEISQKEMRNAYDDADDAFKQALCNASKNIKEYHEKQVQRGYEIQRPNGALLGQIVRGLDRVGIYVPGGTAAYPSTVLMNTIPAKLAGVGEIIMLTPPAVRKEKSGALSYGANPDILAAAYIAGVDRIFLAGGAQAIGGMAYGTATIPRVDKIVGPGNIYVATAKRSVYGQVDIDMIAGPSEILILADETADPGYVAADLLSQAEHDPMSAAILLTTDEALAKKTIEMLRVQSACMKRKETIDASLKNYGLILISSNEDEMIEIANRIAPEHLQIMTSEPMKTLPKIKNAGSVFCGSYSPEPLGDYYSGTNHVLPTMGTARFASPLSVDSFTKKMSYTYYTREALETCKKDIMEIARREGLEAHGKSISIRFMEER